MDFSSIAYISRVFLSNNDSEKKKTKQRKKQNGHPVPLRGQRATRDNKADLFGFSTRNVLIIHSSIYVSRSNRTPLALNRNVSAHGRFPLDLMWLIKLCNIRLITYQKMQISTGKKRNKKEKRERFTLAYKQIGYKKKKNKSWKRKNPNSSQPFQKGWTAHRETSGNRKEFAKPVKSPQTTDSRTPKMPAHTNIKADGMEHYIDANKS